MQRAESLEKTLVLGKIEGKKRSGQYNLIYINLRNLQKIMKDRESCPTTVHGIVRSQGLATEKQQQHLAKEVLFLKTLKH